MSVDSISQRTLVLLSLGARRPTIAGIRHMAVVESRNEAAGSEVMAAKGHDVAAWHPWTWRAGSVCCILYVPDTRISLAGADPRRPCYSIGW